MEAQPANNIQIAHEVPSPIANPFTLNPSIFPPYF